MTDVCADLQYPSDDGIPQPILFDDEDDESILDQSQIDFDDESGTETVMSEDESPYWTLIKEKGSCVTMGIMYLICYNIKQKLFYKYF
jgi:hypothetical protein